jgi:hypothetical protein
MGALGSEAQLSSGSGEFLGEQQLNLSVSIIVIFTVIHLLPGLNLRFLTGFGSDLRAALVARFFRGALPGTFFAENLSLGTVFGPMMPM